MVTSAKKEKHNYYLMIQVLLSCNGCSTTQLEPIRKAQKNEYIQTFLTWNKQNSSNLSRTFHIYVGPNHLE